jgi:hypothetical protein
VRSSVFKVGLAEFEFNGRELAPENLDQKIAATARRLQKARVNALCLAFDEVEHRLDQPRWGEDLSVIGDALLGFDVLHKAKAILTERYRVLVVLRGIVCVRAQHEAKLVGAR